MSKSAQITNSREVAKEGGDINSLVLNGEMDENIGELAFSAFTTLSGLVLYAISGDIIHVTISVGIQIVFLPILFMYFPDVLENIGWTLRQTIPRFAKSEKSGKPVGDVKVKDRFFIADYFSDNNYDSVYDTTVDRSELDLFEVYGLSGCSEQDAVLGSRDELLVYKEGVRND